MRFWSGEEIFSQMNTFSQLSQIIFSYDEVQKILHNYFIQSNNNSVIDLFIKDLKQLFFCLDVSKNDIIKIFVFFESLIVLSISVKREKNWKTILT